MTVCNWSEWGVSISQEFPRKTWIATSDIFFDIVEYFDAPERESFLVTRSELENYIKETISTCESNYSDDEEFKELKKFLADSISETFYFYAEW
jgi:hypothetical protein